MCIFSKDEKRYREMVRLNRVCGIAMSFDKNFKRRIGIILNPFSGTLMQYNMQRFIIMTKRKIFNILFYPFYSTCRNLFRTSYGKFDDNFGINYTMIRLKL